MKTFIQFLLIAEIAAGPVMRQNTQPIQLYSRTGKFMNILESGKVMPKRGRQHMTAIIEPVMVGNNRFKLQGVKTGLYIKISKNNKLRAVPFASDATIFSEEMLQQNNFSAFRLADRPHCRMSVTVKSYRISCSQRISTNKISFLRRPTHVPNSGRFGRFM